MSATRHRNPRRRDGEQSRPRTAALQGKVWADPRGAWAPPNAAGCPDPPPAIDRRRRCALGTVEGRRASQDQHALYVQDVIQTSCVRVEGLNWARGLGGSVGVGVEGQPVAGGERWRWGRRWGLTACVLVYYYSNTVSRSLEKSRWTYTWTRTVRPRSAGRGRSPSRTSSRVAASRGAQHGRHPGAGRFLGNQPQRGDARHQGSQAKRVPAAPRPSGGAAAVVQERPGLGAPWRGRRSGQHARGVVTS